MYCKEIRKKGIVLSLTQEKKTLARRNTLNRFLVCVSMCARACHTRTAACVCAHAFVSEFVHVLHVCVHAAIRACLCRQYVNVHYRSNES